ncbi:MAG TPA: hypothetical protein VJ180_05175 [Pyrinomonadaceae bacterium]|nr:hypothetical protein [Pyrinomonadaceae bacterium]
MKRIHFLIVLLLLIACVSFAFSSAVPSKVFQGDPATLSEFKFTSSSSPLQTPTIPVPSPSPVATPSIPVPTPWPGAILEDPIAQLRTYLLPLGISVVESKLIHVHKVRSYRTVFIDWKSYRDAPDLVDYNSTDFERINELTLINITAVRQGTMQALGSVAMTGEEIFVAGVNAESELVWWTRIRDPRLVRAESADSEGRMQGRTYHRSRVEFYIDLPDNPTIKTLKLFLPQAVGSQLTLVEMYALPLNQTQAQ